MACSNCENSIFTHFSKKLGVCKSCMISAFILSAASWVGGLLAFVWSNHQLAQISLIIAAILFTSLSLAHTIAYFVKR
ncbi:MAG: DUF3624 family protein [Fibrobacteria bacterium]|nr:DUF3624 family protein [Fibrobacteria bacterium]